MMRAKNLLSQMTGLLTLILLTMNCGFPATNLDPIELSSQPYLFSILDASVTLATNTNPLVELELQGHPDYFIKEAVLITEVYRDDKLLYRYPREDNLSAYYIHIEDLAPLEERTETAQVWGFYYFNRVHICIYTVQYEDQEPIICDPTQHDCQCIDASLRRSQ